MHNAKNTLKAIANGDRNAFRELYRAHADMVYNTALAYAQNQEDAEEITQDVFIKVHRYAAKFKGDSAVSTWIYRITVNTSLNLLKKRKRRSIFVSEEIGKNAPDFEHPGVQLEKKEQAQTLYLAIETLPDSQKTAFILSFVEELPRQEVADVMETSLKAVESLLMRAKKNLREKLENEYHKRRKNRKP